MAVKCIFWTGSWPNLPGEVRMAFKAIWRFGMLVLGWRDGIKWEIRNSSTWNALSPGCCHKLSSLQMRFSQKRPGFGHPQTRKKRLWGTHDIYRHMFKFPARPSCYESFCSIGTGPFSPNFSTLSRHLIDSRSAMPAVTWAANLKSRFSGSSSVSSKMCCACNQSLSVSEANCSTLFLASKMSEWTLLCRWHTLVKRLNKHEIAFHIVKRCQQHSMRVECETLSPKPWCSPRTAWFFFEALPTDHLIYLCTGPLDRDPTAIRHAALGWLVIRNILQSFLARIL